MNTEKQPTQSKEGPDAILAIKDKTQRLKKIENCIDESILTQLAKKVKSDEEKKAIISNEFTPYDIAVKLGTEKLTLYPSLVFKMKSKAAYKAKPKEQRRIAAYTCNVLRKGSPLIYLALVKDICGPLFHAPRSVRAKQLMRNVTKTSSPLLYFLAKDFKKNVTENELLKNITPPIITKLNKELVRQGVITSEQAGKAAKRTLNYVKEDIKKGVKIGEDIIDFHIKMVKNLKKAAREDIKTIQGTVNKIGNAAKSMLNKERNAISRGYNYLKNLLEF